MNDVLLLKFMFQEDFPTLSNAIQECEEIDKVEIEETITAKEAATILASYAGGGVVVACLKSKENMMEIASFLKKESKILSSQSFKFIIIDFIKNQEYTTLLEKMNVTEIISPDIESRALKTKLGFWLSSFLRKDKDEAMQSDESDFRIELDPNDDSQSKLFFQDKSVSSELALPITAAIECENQTINGNFYDFFYDSIIILAEEWKINASKGAKINLMIKAFDQDYTVEGSFVESELLQTGGAYIVIKVDASQSFLKQLKEKRKENQLAIAQFYLTARGA